MNSMNLNPLFFRLPGVQRFTGRLVEDLKDMRNLLLLVPEGVRPGDIWHAVGTELLRCDFEMREVWLPEMRQDHPPAAVLGDALGAGWPSQTAPRTIANLVLAQSLPDVVYLEGLADLDAERRVKWTDFLVQWAQACKAAVDRGHRPATFCLICPAYALPIPVPEESLYLSLRWWWGIPAALDIQLLCRICAKNGGNGGFSDVWRENILPSLAGSDVLLAEWLWDKIYSSTDELICSLEEFAFHRGWTRERLQQWGAQDWQRPRLNHGATGAPQAGDLLLWGQGVVGWSPEYGLALHSAALVLLNRLDELRHRLWRAQAAALLPLVESIRLGLCRYLTSNYGQDWPFRWQQPQTPREIADVRQNPLVCQWGHLEQLLRNCLHLSRERRWIQLVSSARQIRNTLAHSQTLDFNSYTAFCREAHNAEEILW